jgi:putative ABC transport system permease protein
MNWFKQLFSRGRLYNDLSDEIQEHLDEKIEELVASGISREEAAHAARREFGNVTLIENDSREIWRWPALENFLADLHYALRTLRKSPGFVTVVVFSLAVGIGATTAIFSVVYGILLDPYPYKDANRIVHVELHDRNGRFSQLLVNDTQFEDIRGASSVEDVFFQDGGQEMNLTGEKSPVALYVGFYSLNVFSYLGVQPLLGREFTPADAPGGNPAPVAVLSYRLWQEHYGGSREEIGKTIELDRTPYTVIGVMPPRFTWGDSDVYLPEAPKADPYYYWMAFPRLKLGTDYPEAEAELQVLVDRFAKEDQKNYPQGTRVKIVTLKDEVLGRFAGTIVFLFGAVAVLLIIGCANVSILFLARGTTRQHEFAVRTSMGAGRGRLVRQLLTESVLLSVTGAALGVLAAYWGLNAIRSMLPYDSFPHEAAVRLNGTVLVFSAAIAVITGILFGISPAVQLSRPQPGSLLQSSSAKVTGRAQTRKMHRLPIAGQVALTLLLLAGAGGATKAFLARLHASLGFDPDHVFFMFVELPKGTAATREERIQEVINEHEMVREAMAQTPGVAEAAVSSWRPGWGRDFGTKIEIQSKPTLTESEAVLSPISPQSFSVLGMPLFRGRVFDSAEVRRQAHLAMVNQAFVEQYLGDLDPIGQRLRIPSLKLENPYLLSPKAPDDWLEVVGVVGDAINDALDRPVKPAIFLPYSLEPGPGELYYVRASGDTQMAIRSVKARLREVNPEIVMIREHTLQWALDTEGWGRERLIAAIFALYAGIALVLAATGLYSVVSFAVTQRTQELGIRMALGAGRGSVVQLVLSSTGAMLGVGIAAGLIISAILGPLVSAWGGGSLSQPLTLLGAALVLVLVAALACVLPAWRAASIDPMQALRVE